MARRITVDPVTRIEGHAKVLIDLADDGSVDFAGLVVNELRGFERILVGMEADRMPLVTGRICGVCPSAHHLAAVKALENALKVKPTKAALLQRELLYMGHVIHSHAVHLFALAGPDMIFGIDGDPARRNIVGIVEAEPEIARKALRLRTLGQSINEKVGGRGIHPVTAIIGGMSIAMTEEKRGEVAKMAEESLSLVKELAGVVISLLHKQIEKNPGLKDQLLLSTSYMGTVKNGALNFYDGNIRLMDEEGDVTVEFKAPEYDQYMVEQTAEWSYMKSVFAKIGSKEKVYRVGSLARINCADSIETPEAQKELEKFREAYGRPCHHTVLQLHARLIELLYACEKAVQLVGDNEIMGEPRVSFRMAAGKGAGHVEAPRGVLVHEYEVDEKGIVRAANMIIATQQNYEAINDSIKQAVQMGCGSLKDDVLLNSVEFAIRTYDPCLSCATHAVGRMPLSISLRQGGRVVREVRRG
jgi:F420-non-reducing hydrogenase large subunit